MCDVKNHYKEYAEAEAVLRRFGVGREMPGFEYLRTGAVIAKADGIKSEEELLKQIEEQCFVVRSQFVKKHAPVKQHMLEAIRSVSKTDRKLTISDFIDRMVWVMETDCEYAKAEAILQKMGVNKKMPGFEYLCTGAVIAEVNGFESEEDLLQQIEDQCFLAREQENHSPIKTLMLEAIRTSRVANEDITTFIENVVSQM